jgi:hypothetical protein
MYLGGDVACVDTSTQLGHQSTDKDVSPSLGLFPGIIPGLQGMLGPPSLSIHGCLSRSRRMDTYCPLNGACCHSSHNVWGLDMGFLHDHSCHAVHSWCFHAGNIALLSMAEFLAPKTLNEICIPS